MKLKMSENSLFAILLRSSWWISFCVVAVITLASVALLPKDYVAFGVMGSFPFLVIGLMAARKQWHAPNPARVAEALTQSGAMSWRDFSAQMQAIYTSQGYAVTRLNSSAADFALLKNGQTTLVSCKRWKAASQGVDGLRDLLAAKAAQGAQQCTYVSLVPVSDTARRFAVAQQVTLLCDQDLGRFLIKKSRP
ncbi:MAG: restriction endonuclease [Rhodoferax sp.]|uniref:restriction endonuclease n=1 Tax=Rhodoferax sp. TaxID=50421 RepID=UPI002608975D|nr:restriction endonuclease [Rhodoferax sp.]MDD2882619.1 restriction endonuclease [Rhodoferax sp.]